MFLITSHRYKGTKGVFIDEDIFQALSEDEWLTKKAKNLELLKWIMKRKILETEFINK